RFRAPAACSRVTPEPAQAFQPFFAGQPMLISMICAPWSTLWRAASAITSGTVPAICTPTGSGSSTWSMRRSDFSVRQKRGSLVVISDIASPAPSRLHSSRNGLSVTPAIGARITLGVMSWGPMRICAFYPRCAGPIRPGPRRLPGSAGLVVHGRVRGVGLHRGDAVVAPALVGIHLAAADRLAVGRGEVEEELAVTGGLAVEAGVVLAVLAHRFDAVGARALGRIALAAQDHLPVAGLEVELEFAVGAL